MSVLSFGELLSGKLIEQIVSTWPSGRFLQLSNALILSYLKRTGNRIPEWIVTEREYAKDRGVDACVRLPAFPAEEITDSYGLVGPGKTVYQVKLRDIHAQDRSKIVGDLCGKTAQELKKMADSGELPDRYVLITNINLSVDEQNVKFPRALGEQLPEGRHCEIQVIGAAHLEAILAQRPHLQYAFFSPEAFITLEKLRDEHARESGYERYELLPALVGRQKELETLTNALTSPRIRVIALFGAAGVGKTRIVLESLQGWEGRVVLALDPDNVSSEDLHRLESHNEIVLVVEEPAELAVDKLLRAALALQKVKLLLLTRTAITLLPDPQRTRAIKISCLSSQETSQLLNQVAPDLDFNLQEWILSQAAGNPQVILAAAREGAALRDSSGDFFTQIGEVFWARLRLPEQEQRALQCLSLLTEVGVSGSQEEEGSALAQFARIDFSNIIRHLPSLENRGLIQKRGSRVRVISLFLAQAAARRALLGRKPAELLAVFAGLSRPGRVKLLRRLAELTDPSSADFFASFLGEDGLYSSLDSLKNCALYLPELASLAPDRLLITLERLLRNAPKEKLRELDQEVLDLLIQALDHLVIRTETFRGAAKLLFILAQWGDNSLRSLAAESFSDIFWWQHFQLPISTNERLSLLQEMLESALKEGKLIIAQAIVTALSQGRGSLFLMSPGRLLEPPAPPVSWSEVHSYARGLAKILLQILAEIPDSETVTLQEKVLQFASDILHQVFNGFEFVRREGGALKFSSDTVMRQAWYAASEVLEWVSRTVRSERQRVDIANVVEGVLEQFGALGELLPEVKNLMNRLQQLKLALWDDSFSKKLRRFAGTGTSAEWEEDAQAKRRGETAPSVLELRKLATEALDRPDYLSQDLLDWLSTPEAGRSSYFFEELGKLDVRQQFLQAILKGSSSSIGRFNFGFYFSGWTARDRQSAEHFLDSAIEQGLATPEALLEAASKFSADESSLRRIEKILGHNFSDHEALRRSLGIWIDELPPILFSRLLRAVGRENWLQAEDALELLCWWVSRKTVDEIKGLVAEILKANSRIAPALAYQWDLVAARLAEADPEEALELFAEFLQNLPAKKINDFLARIRGFPKLWEILSHWDRGKLLKAIFALKEVRSKKLFLSVNMPSLIVISEDKAILLEVARSGEPKAVEVASCLDASQEAFWGLTESLICEYPESEKLRLELERRAVSVRGTGGSFTDECAARAQLAEQLVQQTEVFQVRDWARRVARMLRGERDRNLLWDYDISSEEFCEALRNNGSPEYNWAVERVLRELPAEEIVKLLSREDIKEGLSRTSMKDERKHQVLENALKHWQGLYG